MGYDKLVDSTQLDADLTTIADAIRAKAGTSEPLAFPYGYKETVEGISAGEDFLGARLGGTLSEYRNDNVTLVSLYTFMYCSQLQRVDLPKCEEIGTYAFGYCSALTSVSFPNCTLVKEKAFTRCSGLISVNFPNCSEIYPQAFNYCSVLTSVSFPLLEKIGSSAFSYCSALTSVSFPNCTIIYSSAFQDCSSLTSVNFPSCETLQENAFRNCVKLSSVSFPELILIYRSAFTSCRDLAKITLEASTLCKLSNSNAFTSTPIASGTGYIYVPASLVAGYQSATNWAYYSAQISAIEDMT